MSEPEVATKAPESDAVEAHEAQAAGNEAQSKSEHAMGEHCTSDRPTPPGQQPSGEMTKFNETEVYISKPADYPNSPGKLLLMLTGGTGVHSTNNQLQADAFAKEGFLVVMPDQFAGDPAPTSTTAEEDTNPTLLEQIKLGFASTAKSFLIDMWLARHTPEKVLPVVRKALDTAKDEYADAVANGGGVYAVGYCFGAKYVMILAGDQHDITTQKSEKADEEQAVGPTAPLIKAGAVAHATSVTRADLTAVQSPLSLVCVEDDPLFPDEILEFGKKTFAASKVDYEVELYPGVPHGFAVVGEYGSDKIKDAQSKAFTQMLEWLQKH